MSEFYDILKATKDNLAAYIADSGVPVVLRRRAIWTQTDPLPIIVVAPFDTEVIKGMDFLDSVYWEYPIAINMIYPDNRHQDLELDAQEYLDLRQRIRYFVFYQLIAEVPDVWDVDTSPRTTFHNTTPQGTKPFNLEDAKATYSSTIWLVKYKTRELRRNGPV